MGEQERLLSEEDLDRVDRVLHSPTYTADRKPFRPWRLMFLLWLLLLLLGGVSYGLAKWHGVI